MQTLKSITSTVGLPPGSLVHIGGTSTGKSKIKYIEFAPSHFKELDLEDTKDIPKKAAEGSVIWINIDGLGSVETIRSIGERFGLHHLLLEDILNTFHRPKFEEFDKHLFTTLKMIGLNPQGEKIVVEHVSIIMGEGYVISIQEKPGDVFEPFRERLRTEGSPARSRDVPYIFYRLIDLIVDNYYYVTEHLDEKVDNLEAEVMLDPDKEARIAIQKLKTRISNFRKYVLPLREAVLQTIKSEHPLLNDNSRMYLKDVYDHLMHIIESIENQKDQISNILDLFLSGISFKMNQIMQVLTIIATIFIPLTFIAGIYGMNFKNMPELEWNYGYFYVLGGMFLVLLGMLMYFRNKKWL